MTDILDFIKIFLYVTCIALHDYFFVPTDCVLYKLRSHSQHTTLRLLVSVHACAQNNLKATSFIFKSFPPFILFCLS